MGLQDRDYLRNGKQNGLGYWVRQLLFGEFAIGTFWDIRVRIHASLVLLLAFRILLPGPMGFQTAVISSAILFGVILLHEFGHCFAARSVGGRGDDVLLWPLGGLAFVDTPRRPWPSFVGTAGGPLVNVLICVACALALRITSGAWVMGNPLAPFLASMSIDFSGASFYLWWIYSTSLSLLLFNLLPIFPLDGGRMLQATLWPRLGYYRSMEIACVTGMAASVVMGLLSLGSIWMMFLWFSCFMTCYQTKMNLRELADQAWEEERKFTAQYGGSYGGNTHPDRARTGLPRVSFGKGKPKDDRFTPRDLSPLRWLKKRNERKKFEKLMSDD